MITANAEMRLLQQQARRPTRRLKLAPWETDMTLCIAAAAQSKDGDPQIVLCSDELVTTGTASSQTEVKRQKLGRSPFVAMFSGVISEARELLSAYEDYLDKLSSYADLSVDDWMTHLREPLRLHKKDKVNDLTRRRLALTYEQFMTRKTQAQRPDQLFTAVSREIDELTIEVDLLFATFLGGADRRPLIFRERLEQVENHENFACIGIGAEAADQALHRRELVNVLPLPWVLYYVYEAKKMSELAPAVGRRTSIEVMVPVGSGEPSPSYRSRHVTLEGLDFLESQYKRYGPQPVGDLSIPSNVRMFW